MSPRSYELPIDRIRTVVVERKSVIPFATATVLAAVSAVVAKYNALWFIINLTPENMTRISTIAFGLMVLCAIPAMSRALFVSVAISWDGQPASFRARFVPARQGRGLAAKFQAISLES